MTTAERVLCAIATYHAEHGYAPSFRDIATAIDSHSTGQITYHIGLLSQAALIRLTPHTARSLRLTPTGERRVAQLQSSAAA